MSFSTELDKALAELYFTAYVEGRNETPDNEDKQDEYEKIHTKPVKAAIIELVKKEVIGEDEVFIDIPILDHLGRQTSVIDGKSYTPYMVAKNQLRAEQRKKLEGEKE